MPPVTMRTRFEGADGRRRLIEALLSQTVVEGADAVAQGIAQAGAVEEYAPGSELIRQGAADNHVFFIVSGSARILVNGREVNRRKAGQHVGEMALIDPKAVRSASVVALETCVVTKLGEPEFTKLAERHPRLWRLIALELGERLRQRNDLVRPVNLKPVMFVGSSAEALPVAKALQGALDKEPVVVRLWTDGVFGASKFAIESLAQQATESDFAILVLAPDDRVTSRAKEMDAPRDNVVFELGLFMGFLTRDRTFLLKPKGVDIKIPSDLLGITALEFAAARPEDLPDSLAPACDELRGTIRNLGPK